VLIVVTVLRDQLESRYVFKSIRILDLPCEDRHSDSEEPHSKGPRIQGRVIFYHENLCDEVSCISYRFFLWLLMVFVQTLTDLNRSRLCVSEFHEIGPLAGFLWFARRGFCTGHDVQQCWTSTVKLSRTLRFLLTDINFGRVRI
jgi:hypothetical protein